MIPYANIKKTNPNGFYTGYELSEEDIEWLRDMAEQGREQEAIDILVSEYMLPAGIKYQNLMSEYLFYSESGILKEEDKNHLIRNIALLTLGLSVLFRENFSKFIKSIYARKVFKDAGLTTPDVKKAILEATLSDFDARVAGAMQQTQIFLTNGIRTLQREIISENLYIDKSKLTGEILDTEVERFKRGLRNRYPTLYNAMQKGNVLVSRQFGPDGERVRHYTIDYYADLAIRTSLLNVDRNANETMAIVNDEKVVGYILADPRKVKKEREICQHILNTKVFGRSVLALDETTAESLGVMTVEEAKSTPDYALGPFCRHTLVRMGSDFLKKISEAVA